MHGYSGHRDTIKRGPSSQKMYTWVVGHLITYEQHRELGRCPTGEREAEGNYQKKKGQRFGSGRSRHGGVTDPMPFWNQTELVCFKTSVFGGGLVRAWCGVACMHEQASDGPNAVPPLDSRSRFWSFFAAGELSPRRRSNNWRRVFVAVFLNEKT